MAMELRALRTVPATAPQDGYTVVVLDDRLCEALRRALDRPAVVAAGPTVGVDRLTDREREVLRLLAEGLSNAEIAQRLFVSGATVKCHVAQVLRKLGVRDRVQAVVAAFRGGLCG